MRPWTSHSCLLWSVTVATVVAASPGSKISASTSFFGGPVAAKAQVETPMGEDMTMGVELKDNKVNAIYCKLTETWADLLIKMRLDDSSITGSVDTTYSGLRTVAEFDTTTDSLLTKVAVTSEKMSLGSVPFTLKPTYDVLTKLLDLDVEAEVTDETTAVLSTSQKGSKPTKLAITHRVGSNSICAVGSTGSTKLEVSSKTTAGSHTVGGKLSFSKFVPSWQAAWSLKMGSRSAKVSLDGTEAELETSAKFGAFGEWTVKSTTPLKATRDTRLSLATKLAV